MRARRLDDLFYILNARAHLRASQIEASAKRSQSEGRSSGSTIVRLTGAMASPGNRRDLAPVWLTPIVRCTSPSLTRIIQLRANCARCHRPQDAAESGAFHVTRRGAGGGVPQAVAHGAQFADRPVEFVRLGREHLPVDARPARPART